MVLIHINLNRVDFGEAGVAKTDAKFACLADFRLLDVLVSKSKISF